MSTISEVAEFWNRQPCGVFDAENKRYLEEPHILNFADFSRWQGKKVLEIGPGIGTDAVNFARAGADYTGVELSERSLALVKKKFATFNLRGNFYIGNAEELSSFVPVEPYDLVWSWGVIHHTPQPEKILAEIKKYCSPRTEIRIMLYAKWSWKVWRIILRHGGGAFWKMGELVRTYSEAQADCPVVNIYSFREARKLLRDFDVLEMRKDYLSLFGREKTFIYGLSRFIRRWLERFLGWNILIVAKYPASQDSGG